MNRTSKILLAIVLILLTALLALVLAPNDDRRIGDMPGMEGMQGMDGMEGMEGMQDPSGPAGISGMEMGDMEMGGTISLAERDIQTFGITFGTAESRSMSRTVRAVGTVHFDDTRITRVAPRFGGWVEDLQVDFTGRTVQQGEPLMEVYSPALVTAQEELLLAARMLDDVGDSRVTGVGAGARELLASARRRLEYWDISGDQIDRLLESSEVQRTLTVHAPASGVVTELAVTRGEAFQPGATLYTISDLTEVWVQAEIFEDDLPLIREGMETTVTVDAIPGRTFRGRVEYLYPTLDDRSRSMRARIALPNPERTLKPGMYATVRLDAALGETLTVPASAILRTGEQAVVFVRMDDGRVMPHEVVLGITGDQFVQVISGLGQGDTVVTSAQFLLDSESNLAEVMQAMMMQMGSSDMSGMEMDGMDMDGGAGDMGGMDMGGGMGSQPDTAGGR
jgi:RND family efflux transporter MFP subunit